MTLDSHVLEALDDPGLSLGLALLTIGDQQVASAMRLIDASRICARRADWKAADRNRVGEGREEDHPVWVAVSSSLSCWCSHGGTHRSW